MSEGPRVSALVLLILTLGLFGLFAGRRLDLTRTPFILAQDQTIVNGTVTVRQVRSTGAGWVVVYRAENAALGEVIGFTPVPAGQSANVIIPVNVQRVTSTLYAVLHQDLGTPNLFEYPGLDEPVLIANVPVLAAFQVLDVIDDPGGVPPIGGAPTPIPPLPTPFVPPPGVQSITVIDQPLVNETVTVLRVVALQRSWLTIHADENGQPGMILGAETVMPGEMLNIVIPINVDDMTITLHAALYADLGAEGAFEIPGADTPIIQDGQRLAVPFNITGGIPIILPPGGGEPLSLLFRSMLGTLSGMLGIVTVAASVKLVRRKQHRAGSNLKPTDSGTYNAEKRICYR